MDKSRKKKIQQALDAGYSQQDIDNYMAQRGMVVTQADTQPYVPTPKQRKGNFFTDLIPMVTGGIGAAAGTFVAPGGGTIVGGAGGSALGEWLRQKLVGEDTDIGNIATEAAWGTIPGVGKVASNAARGTKAAVMAARVADTASDASKVASAASRGGKLAKTGANMRLSARGFQNAGKVFDSASERKAASRLLSEFGLKGSAQNQFDKIDDVIGTLGNQADEIYQGTNRTLTTGEFAKRLRGKAGGVISSDKSAYREAATGVEKLVSSAADGNQLSASKLYQIKKNLGTQLDSTWKKIQNGTSLAPKEEALMNAWRTADDALIQLAPEAKKLTKAQSIMMKSRSILDKSQAVSSELQPLGIPLGRTRTPSRLGGAIQDATGRALETISGSAPARAAGAVDPGMVRQGLGAIAQQGITRGVGNTLLGGGEEQPQQEQISPELLMQLTGAATTPGEMAGFDPFGGGVMEQPQGGLTNEQKAAMILQDLDQNGGKNVPELEKVFEYLTPQAAEGAGPNITSVTAQQYGLAQTGQQSLDQMANLLAADPGVLDRTRIPGRDIDLFGIGGSIANATGTSDFDTIGYNIADSLLRLRTGATANESEVRKLQSQIMPRAGDSPETVQLKLQQLRQSFGGVLNLANQQPSQAFNPFMQFNQQPAMGMPF